MKTDSLFYKLFNYAPNLLFELVDLHIADTTGYQFRSEEIKQTAFRIDGLFIPAADHKEQPLVFVEVQFQTDEDFYSRFFSELFLYLRYQKPQHPWQAVVIYPNRNIEKSGVYQHYQVLLESEQVHRVYLDDLAHLTSNSLEFQLIQLIVAKQAQAVAQAQSLVKQAHQLDSKQQLMRVLDIIEAIMVCKLPRLSREEIQKMLDFIELDIKKTQFYQDVVAENKQEWIEKGELNLILRLCKRRYGNLPSSVITRMQHLNSVQLETLADFLVDNPNKFELADLESWLQTQLNN